MQLLACILPAKGEHMHRWTLLAALAATSLTAHGQTIRAQGPKPMPAKPAYRPAQPYDSMAKDTTPLSVSRSIGS